MRNRKTTAMHLSSFAVTDGYRRYVLILLLIVYIFNFIDRQIVAILLPEIKAELGLSDSQLGLLTGFAFALFYVTFGIPIANLADRKRRVPIIAGAVAIWSGMTALCGLAQNFVHLLIARIGVGVGEAGCTPPAHSLIADYFPPNRRAMALAVYSMGTAVGGGLGLFFGGWMSDTVGWRMAFIFVGLPGLLLAVFVWLTIKEPPRGYADGVDRSTVKENIPLHDGIRILLKNPCFRHITIATAYISLMGYGFANWIPSFFSRNFGAAATEIGAALGLVNVLGGGAGILLGGYLGDKLASRDPRRLVDIPFIIPIFGLPFLYLAFTASSLSASILWFVIP
ncbi:MAG: MFS transporter, partial [Deltaproteobacteria bacterium]|nr:MFS transporter [Deltaproteobacteria bacterium]